MRRALRPRVCVPPPPRVAESRADTCAPRDVPRARSRPEGAGQEALQDARRGVARARRAAGPFAGGGGLCPPRAARNVGRAEGGQAALRLASAASRRRGGGCSVRDLNTARASCWWHSGGLRRSSPARPCGWACGAWSYRWWPARLQRGGTGTRWANVARSYSYRWWRVRVQGGRVSPGATATGGGAYGYRVGGCRPELQLQVVARTGTGWANVARSYSYRWWRVRVQDGRMSPGATATGGGACGGPCRALRSWVDVLRMNT